MNAEQKKRYFAETALALNREGFHTETIPGGTLGVWLGDHPLCEVDQIGGITYRSTNILAPEHRAAKSKVYDIVCTTAEYMKQIEQAPPLKAAGLEYRFVVLAEFNDTVLAARESKYGMEFVTWDWDFDRKGVSHGHYYGGNYDGAKQDFATRSGLVSEQQLFKDEQLIEIYRCCADTLEDTYDMTDKQRACIKGVQEQIECVLPDIMERIRAHDQQVLAEETQTQGLTMK